jgi:predicted HAD superfamily Cof-like phosphohydrolase
MYKQVEEFMVAGDVETEKFNPRLVALYVGLQLEEMIEKLEPIADMIDKYDRMRVLRRAMFDMETEANKFKSGYYDPAVNEADRTAMLDADIDLAWVSFGGSYAMGADVEGAANEVARSNLSKVNKLTGKMDKDANGKIMKPADFSPPNLAQFVS